ncbi:unnamed protein product [Cunninghamella blakesleeana]
MDYHCPSEYTDYKISSDDIYVDDFFYSTPAINWDFLNYFHWYVKKYNKTNTKISTITNQYYNNTKIKNCGNISKEIKTYVGRLSNTVKTSNKGKKPETPTTSSNTYNYYRNSAVNYDEDNNVIINDETSDTDDDINNDTYIRPEETTTHPSLPHKRKSSDHYELTSTSLLRSFYNDAYALFKNQNAKLDHLKPIKESSLQTKLYNHCLLKMKDFRNLDLCDQSFLRVSLYGIINTINIQHRPCLIGWLSDELQLILEDHQMNHFDIYTDDSQKPIIPKLGDVYKNHGINGLRKTILKLKFDAYESNIDVPGSNNMIMLDIIEHILNMIQYSNWNEKQSEAYFLEWWCPVFRFLFRNNKHINLKTGETASIATKYDRQVNETMHACTSKNIGGKKIDLLLCCNDTNPPYEPSSIEIKTSNVSETTDIIQRNKNIRINKSILSRIINCTNDDETSVLEMDIIGFSCCIYSIKKYDDIVAAVKITKDDLYLPTDELELKDFLEDDAFFPTL